MTDSKRKALTDAFLDVAQKMTGQRGLIPLNLVWQPTRVETMTEATMRDRADRCGKTDHVLDDYLRRYGSSWDKSDPLLLRNHTHNWNINEGEDDMDFTDTADSVEIKFSGNGGWMVKVGCHTRVYINAQDLLSDLGEYLADPKATMKTYNGSTRECPTL